MRISHLALIGLLLASSLAHAVETRPKLPPHPRLLATPADFARIKAAVAQPGPLRDAFEVLKATVEYEADEPPYERVLVGRRMLGVSRDALRRIWNGALLYRLTGNREWAARAEEEMLALADFTDWNPSHFLDTAEAATAMAIGYDWLYDTLSPTSRLVIRDALVENALLPGARANAPWRRLHNNWRQVCETGLALAALAVADERPDIAWSAIQRAKANVGTVFDTYAPAGAYVEGPTYWDYGTTYHVVLIEALRTATGSAGPLATNAAFLKSGSVMNMLTTATGGLYNYGDSLYKRPFMPAMFWFARENRQPEIAAVDQAHVSALARKLRAAGTMDGSFTSRFLALALLWGAPGPAAAPPAFPSSWSTQGTNPLAIFRQGAGPKSLYVAMKGGRARSSHAHMDAGSFLLELGGVRWTEDLGMPDYTSLEKAGVDLFGKDRWKVYALGPFSHSIPLIDNIPPNELATGTLLGYSARNQSATFDLTALYRDHAQRLHRSVRVTSPTSVTLRDEFVGLAVRAHYRFTWMTRAAVVIDATGVTLSKGGRTLRLDVSADAPFEIRDEDVSRPRASFDAPNPGLRRISVLLTPLKQAHFISVRASLVPLAPSYVLRNPANASRPNLHASATRLPRLAPLAGEPRLLWRLDARTINSAASPLL